MGAGAAAALLYSLAVVAAAAGASNAAAPMLVAINVDPTNPAGNPSTGALANLTAGGVRIEFKVCAGVM